MEWIVTFKPASGILVKIEKLHGESGERQELTLEEYSALAAMGVPIAVASMSASTAPPTVADLLPVSYQAYHQAYHQAYYQGVYDYVNYLTQLYSQAGADGSLSTPAQDPIEAQRLRLANYAAVHASPGAGTGP